MTSSTQKRVYLAGPDVFEHDALVRGSRYVELASKKGLMGLYPMDNKIDMSGENPDQQIYRANLELLDSSDYVVANLCDFRGYEPDSGTVWEVAYAIGRGKKVIGYIPSNASILKRMHANGDAVLGEDGQYRDLQGRHIENFGNPLNLMLQHSAHTIVHGDLGMALDAVNDLIAVERQQSLGIGIAML